ncbi:MAG: hypothetical protein KF718_22590 [Polyangiaceae bacterium]|nr:hypothetical protein [Polyangiaceae bacterium]
MTRRLVWLLAFGLLGCSAEDPDPGPGRPSFKPKPSGVGVSEAQACEAVRKSEVDRFTALGCGAITRPACPGYLRKAGEACLMYDEGTVLGCAGFISGLSCSQLSDFECVVLPISGSAPSGC